MASVADETRIKIFISYSRADKAFASDLVLGLAACGFAPYIDRQDIAAGEDWEKRLAGLITEADSIVYVISPDSLSSENCAQEFRQALALRKRILPVVWRPVDDAAAPVEMKRLNYIFFSGEGRTFAAGLADLAEALRTDIDWIREQTRLAGLGRRWAGRGKAKELLLRGDDIDAASAWLAAKPLQAPPVADEIADFIKASSDAQAEAERRAKIARTGLMTAVSAAAVVFAGLAGLAGWQWMNAQQANDGLSSANKRLGAEVWLRTAPSDKGYYVVDKGWYRVAANYSGAIARVELSGGGNRTLTGTGFIVEGGLVHPRYAGEPLLLVLAQPGQDFVPTSAPTDTLPVDAPSQSQMTDLANPGPGPRAMAKAAEKKLADTLRANEPSQPQMYLSGGTRPGAEAIVATFPALGEKEVFGSELVWKTPAQVAAEPPFAVWRLASRPPVGWRAIGKDDIECTGLETLPTERTVAVLGVGVPAAGGPSKQALAINISELLDGSDVRSIRYTHATNRASGGAPVFSLSSEKVFAIHRGSEPDPARPGQRRGYGYSLPFLLDVIRSGVKDAQLGPLCG